MDNEMPILDGPGCTRKIRQFYADLRLIPIPIIGISGNVSEDKRKECLEAGMKAVSSKPVKMDEIIKLIVAEILAQ